MRGVGGRPVNALVGVANFLLTLWDVGAPGLRARRLGHARGADLPPRGTRGVSVGPRVRAVDPGAARRAPRTSSSRSGSPSARPAATRPTTSWLQAAAAWDGPVLVATSDRDAFQLVSDRVTVLQPVRGVSELARIGPAEVRERYGVDPAQVPDFIALRGDPSDKHSGRAGHRPEEGGGAARAVRVAGRDARRRTVLDHRRRPAPVPADRDDGCRRAAARTRPDAARLGAGRATATHLGMNALAGRLAERLAAEGAGA